ncbi:MAG: TauD/TfdA family dioxygenase, partial [Defluviicoccus sp.]|nr:TauD/TfdA family dioxygenase [Defluviicoccus sp.]
MALATKKLSPHIGVEVLDIDLATRPDDATIREIYRLWLDHIMVVFRGQSLDQETLLQATSYFGTPGANARPREYRTSGQHDMLPGIMLISNIRAN